MAKKSQRSGSKAMRAKKGSKQIGDLPSGRKAQAIRGGGRKAGGSTGAYYLIKLENNRISS